MNQFTRAAVLVRQKASLKIWEVEIPELSAGQVLVKIAFSGICGKQLDEISGRQGEDSYLPHLLGHEGAGTVVRVGPGVRKVKDGDRVVLHWMKGSGIDSEPPRFSCRGKKISAGWVTTFSDYTVASENRLTPIPDGIRLDAAALLGCAVTTGLGIIFNDAELKPGQSIVIVGAGGIGLNAIHGASLVNAYPVVAVDLFDEKLKRATSFGATHRVNLKKKNARDLLLQLSGGRGFDVAVETTGHKEVREMAYELTHPAGTTVLGGVPHRGESMDIDSFPLHFGRRLVGSHGGNTRPDTDIPRYLKLYQAGKLKLGEQITHRFTLDRVNEALDVVRKGRAARCLIKMS